MPHGYRRTLVTIFLSFLLAGPAVAATRPPVTYPNGMVVTSQRIASEVGAEILRKGGTAVDAAVAVGYALAVVNPCCGNIGGGGFATLHLADGRDVFLNFREKAPLAATEAMYLDDKGEVIKDLSLRGYLAVAVPGTVLGLDTLLRDYGTLPRDVVMAPAIRLAEEGFILDQGDVDILSRAAWRLRPVCRRRKLRSECRWQRTCPRRACGHGTRPRASKLPPPSHRRRAGAMIRQRYGSWDSGIGTEIEAGSHDFASLEKFMLQQGDVTPNTSGRQELFKNVVNRYVF